MTAPPLDSKPIIFSGGPILTMAEPLRVEAITILGDRILRAGSLEDCRAAAGRDREERDLSGRTLMPGFVDAHTHPLMLGQTQTWLDVSPRVAPSRRSTSRRTSCRAGCRCELLDLTRA